MKVRPGQSLVSADGTTVIVVRAADDDVVITCGEAEMVDARDAGTKPVNGHAANGAQGGTLLGKRYASPDGLFEVLCTKPGPGSLAVNGAALSAKTAKQLPSSD